METRSLGRTGLQVPPLCLGTMTFGLQCDEQTSYAILDRAVEGGIDFLDTADVYPLGGTRRDRWPHGGDHRALDEAARQPRQPRARDEVRGRDGPGAERRRAVAEAHHGGDRRQPAPARHRRHRPLPGARVRPAHADRRDAAGARRHRPRGQGALHRLLELSGMAARPRRCAASERLGIARYDSLQPRYNLLYREIETELLPLARAEGLGVIVLQPARRRLPLRASTTRARSRRRTRASRWAPRARRYQYRYWQDAQFDAVEQLRAGRRGAGSGHGVASRSRGCWRSTASRRRSSAPAGRSSSTAPLGAIGLELDDELREACDAAWWSLPRRRVIEGYR